jgi:hypothetical protein
LHDDEYAAYQGAVFVRSFHRPDSLVKPPLGLRPVMRRIFMIPPLQYGCQTLFSSSSVGNMLWFYRSNASRRAGDQESPPRRRFSDFFLRSWALIAVVVSVLCQVHFRGSESPSTAHEELKKDQIKFHLERIEV